MDSKFCYTKRYAAPLCVDIAERIVKTGVKAGETHESHKQVPIGKC